MANSHQQVQLVLLMRQERNCFVTKIKVWIGYHLLRMHYFSTLNGQFTKLEFGQLALKCSK